MFVHLLHNLRTQLNIMNRCVNCVPLSFQQALYVTMHEMDRDKVNQSTHLHSAASCEQINVIMTTQAVLGQLHTTQKSGFYSIAKNIHKFGPFTASRE